MFWGVFWGVLGCFGCFLGNFCVLLCFLVVLGVIGYVWMFLGALGVF